MTRKPPAHLSASGIIGAPVTYAWNDDIALKLIATKDKHPKIYDALGALAYKARMAAAVAVTEWVIWRFEGMATLDDAHKRLDAARASIVHPALVKGYRFQITPNRLFSPTVEIDEPIQIALDHLATTIKRYVSGNSFLAAPIVAQVVLARHVVPSKKTFDGWLAAALRSVAEYFPAAKDPALLGDGYDPTRGDVVTPEAFDPNFAATPSEMERSRMALLPTDEERASNPYLATPEDLKAAGVTQNIAE